MTPKKYPEFKWFFEGPSAFRQKHRLEEIDIDSPQVFKIDQYIKQVCDGLAGHPNILGHFGRSPLNALSFFIENVLAQSEDSRFMLVLQQRVRDDIAWRDLFKTDGPRRDEARTVLRQRGLIR